jgi:hypothetical protein
MTDTTTDTDANPDSNIDVEATESVVQDDADEFGEARGIDMQLIDEGADHDDMAGAIQALKDELRPEDPPESVHLSILNDDGMQSHYFVHDEIEVRPQTDMMGHLANHIDEVGRYLGLSPAATAYTAADVATEIYAGEQGEADDKDE